MRVTGGIHRSRQLKTLEGDTTRPTSDKVRAAIFNRYQLDGMLFLDCFGGSGAMAIEAVSRGAESATVVEKHPGAARVIASNITSLNLGAQVTLLKGDIHQILKQFMTPFDLIFLDPPYGYRDMDQLMEQLVTSSAVAAYTEIIIESDRNDTIHDHYGAWQCYRSKQYGNSTVSYFQTTS